MNRLFKLFAIAGLAAASVPATALADAEAIHGGAECQGKYGVSRYAGVSYFADKQAVYNGNYYYYPNEATCPITRQDRSSNRVDVRLWYTKEFDDEVTCTLYSINKDGSSLTYTDSHTVTAPAYQTSSVMDLSINYQMNKGYLALFCRGPYQQSSSFGIYGYHVTESYEAVKSSALSGFY
jgi:hypothetical protein